MAYKNPDDARAAIQRHNEANKQYYFAKARVQKERLKQVIYELKSNTPCTDCHKIYPHYVMDFDHVGKKTMNISQMLARGSAKAIYVEIAKCQLVCSNCHRARTYLRALSCSSDRKRC